MRLPNYPVRLFRLSCGCLASYPMMPVSYVHEVLCARCRAGAVTMRAYPERACGTRGLDSGIQVACTRERGTCADVHHDEIADVKFTAVPRRLSRYSEGRTGRA